MRSILALGAVFVLLILPSGCSDSTDPTPPQDDQALFEGSIDPNGGEFLLARIDLPGVIPLRIDLIGSNLEVVPDESRVSLDVALRNQSQIPLYPQVVLWISQILPGTVTVTNADILPPTMDPASPIPFLFGFDYSELLGEDGVLEPGESSGAKTWIFHDPGMVSFSFNARVEFGSEPSEGVITGMVFEDLNQNGIHDRNEGPFAVGEIWVTPPEGEAYSVMTEPDGTFRAPAPQPGLYSLRLEILVDCVTCITTPNPRQALVVPDASGVPQPVYGVDFGAVCAACGDVPRPVRLTLAPPDSLQPQNYYFLQDSWIEGSILHLRVGFSGCEPDHPFELVAGRHFMESMPVATWLRLLHDDRGELCEAWWEQDLQFDLRPIQDAHIADYGEPGEVRLRLQTPDGQIHEFRLEP